MNENRSPMGRTLRACLPVSLGVVLAILLGLGGGVPPVPAQQAAPPASEGDALKREVERLKSEVEALKSELKIIREYLARQGRPEPKETRLISRVSLAGRPLLGKKDAPVTLVEFSDYQCPFCRRFFQETFPALKAEFIDTGKLRYVFRDFPLDSLHPHARKAAEAAHCAGEQGKYWPAHDLLFGNQDALQIDRLKTYARKLQLKDPAAFDDCLTKGKYAAVVQKDHADGLTAGVTGTPAFFLGKTRDEDTIEGVLIVGARPLPVFREAIQSLLRGN